MDRCWRKFVDWDIGSKWDIVICFDIVLDPADGDGAEQLGEHLDWRLKLYYFSFQKLLSLLLSLTTDIFPSHIEVTPSRSELGAIFKP